MKWRSITMVIAGLAVLTSAVLSINPGTPAAEAGASDERQTERRTRAFVTALEAKDQAAVVAMLDRNVELTVALSFSGEPEPAGRFAGETEVLGYLTGVFTNMAAIAFVDERVSVTSDGRTSFLQATGDFTTADGRPYRNVYVFRLDWHEGRLVRIEEYGNPITYCQTFGDPDC
ncbi:ketosteroid isomerase-like protein [Actinoalloteichus hoggarensis]|uniref:SnoaL-like domain protein n=1 Tax=Actinoalloteichus hoggarensis TaxID=1470176 RepID=A0A221W3B4_9PSEU|nr:nuclear transport factor 2 family protein [Actinoalloteichus hoggarensis]ASO20288.1 SnoaL-like domain protein [Actinoalloteichus hoggarensis]MBB5918998.1 ketosteroid isomerase-like protein [Actinoalloteichus hoggarensis]